MTALVLMLGLGASYLIAYNGHLTREAVQLTYEQQYPAFESVASTLQTKFKNPPPLSCEGAALSHPMESTIEFWINNTWMHSDALNLLFYGEAMLGKTCAVRKILDRLATQGVPFFYHLFRSEGFDGFVNDLCKPAVVGPNKKRAIYIALEKYRDLVGSRPKNNTLIVIDFATMEYDGVALLASLAKEIRDDDYPVRFVFIASEARAPVTLQRRVRQVRLVEGNNTIAEEYLRKTVRITDPKRIQDIVQFTGSIFKYLSVVKDVWPYDRTSTDADVQAAKEAVFRLIHSEVGFLLDPALYPEVIAVARQLIQHNGTLSRNELLTIAEDTYKEAPKGQTKLSVGEMLERNLFLVDYSEGMVHFQNRATANFVMELLSQNSPT